MASSIRALVLASRSSRHCSAICNLNVRWRCECHARAVAESSEPLTADATGVVYFSSAKLHSVFKLDANGTVRRVAGNGLGPGYSGDGGPATSAALSLVIVGSKSPGGLAVDREGNLFIADSGNNRIRRVSGSGTTTTVAGTGDCGFAGDGGPAINAKLGVPTGFAIDSSGNLFIAERGNNLVRRGDGGPATKAVLAGPAGIAVNSDGNLFIADSFNNRVRKVPSGGIITTLAGNGAGGFSGDDGSALDAQIKFPIGVVLMTRKICFVAQLAGLDLGDGGPAAVAAQMKAGD